MVWVERDLAGQRSPDWGSVRVPYLNFANALSTEEVDTGLGWDNDGSSDKDGERECRVKWHARVRGTFQDNMCVADFPFDVHSLRVKLRIPRLADRLRHGTAGLVLDKERTTGHVINHFALAEWEVLQPSVRLAPDAAKMVSSGVPGAAAALGVARSWLAAVRSSHFNPLVLFTGISRGVSRASAMEAVAAQPVSAPFHLGGAKLEHLYD